MGKFIKTKDDQLAKQLRNRGFICVDFSLDGFYTFINNGKMTFSEEEQNKMVFTNTLFI